MEQQQIEDRLMELQRDYSIPACTVGWFYQYTQDLDKTEDLCRQYFEKYYPDNVHQDELPYYRIHPELDFLWW